TKTAPITGVGANNNIEYYLTNIRYKNVELSASLSAPPNSSSAPYLNHFVDFSCLLCSSIVPFSRLPTCSSQTPTFLIATRKVQLLPVFLRCASGLRDVHLPHENGLQA